MNKMDVFLDSLEMLLPFQSLNNPISSLFRIVDPFRIVLLNTVLLKFQSNFGKMSLKGVYMFKKCVYLNDGIIYRERMEHREEFFIC